MSLPCLLFLCATGTDGCSESEAVLKVTGLNPANSYISDNVYTLQVAEAQSQEVRTAVLRI